MPPPWEPAAKPARSHGGLEAFGSHTPHSLDGGIAYKPLTRGVGPFYVVKAIWSLRLGTSLEDRPRYTPTTTFETFPFPPDLTPDIPADDFVADPRAMAVALEAQRLVDLRDRWLNPPEWVEWVDEPVPGYPKRPVPRDDSAAKELKKRTLTNLYNARPQWLADAHARLDTAVASAYGWPTDISNDDALRELLDLNLAD